MPAVAAIVLAAGASTRMGRAKQFIAYAGEALVRRAARAVVEAGCDPVIVVTGRDHDALAAMMVDLPVTCVRNAHWPLGMGTSIRAGVAHLSVAVQPSQAIEALVIHLCDQPFVNARAVRTLIDAWQASPKPVAVSAWNDTIGPPVVVDASLLPRLAGLPDDSGAKAIWATNPDWIERVDCPAAAVDIDTPADLATLPVEPPR